MYQHNEILPYVLMTKKMQNRVRKANFTPETSGEIFRDLRKPQGNAVRIILLTPFHS